MHKQRYSLINSWWNKTHVCNSHPGQETNIPSTLKAALVPLPSEYSSLPWYEFTTIYPISSCCFQLGANTSYTLWLLLSSSEPVAQLSGLLDPPLPVSWVIILKLGSCGTLGSFLKWWEKSKRMGWLLSDKFSLKPLEFTPTCLLPSFSNGRYSRNRK